MVQQAAYGTQLARYFRLEDAPTLITRTVSGYPLAVTRLRREFAEHEWSIPIPPESAFLVVLQMKDLIDHGLCLKKMKVPVEPYLAGTTSTVSLDSEPTAYLGGPLDSLNFYVPHAALEELSHELGSRRTDSLSIPGKAIDDPVIKQFGGYLLPALDRPAEANRLFVDHIAFGLLAHIAVAYGGMRASPRVMRGGLAPWQVRRAKDAMDGLLNKELSLAQIACECELSVSHFARAFRKTTGQSPHRWLLLRRTEKAKDLLRTSSMTLAEIAVTCGFAEQSHFTRVFKRLIGISPGAWQREHRS